MSEKKKLDNVRTWVEIDRRAAQKNYSTFRKLIGPNAKPSTVSRGGSGTGVKLWSVVKSNAYGHGLVAFSKLVQKLGVDGFCVDSLVEGLRLRKAGIRKPILVLGPTLHNRFQEAAKKKIVISISNFGALKALAGSKSVSQFHIKVDTGMHRQGFYLEDLPRVIKLLNSKFSILNSRLKGIYTHFASAKDVNYPTYTEKQFSEFQKAVRLFEKAGFRGLVKHCAATGATLIDKKYHLDAVRVGIGFYGLWPSKELEMQVGRKVDLRPVLSWRAVISEIKTLKPGDYVGYDLFERVSRDTKIAVIPIGYWHGFPRALSSIGEVIVNGRRARVLGRVSMDLVAVGPVSGCKPGDVVTFIGKDGASELLAFDVARAAGTIHYELLTRLNPLMERVIT